MRNHFSRTLLALGEKFSPKYNSEWMRSDSDWKMSAELTRITRQVSASVDLNILRFLILQVQSQSSIRPDRR